LVTHLTDRPLNFTGGVARYAHLDPTHVYVVVWMTPIYLKHETKV